MRRSRVARSVTSSAMIVPLEHQLHAGTKALGWESRQGPPREGPALLQGRVVCGLCGSGMQIRYRPRRGGQVVPDYVCPGRGRGYAEPLFQSILGTEIEPPKFHDVGELLIERRDKLASEARADVPPAAEISKRLRRERELAFYGDIDFIPTEEYSASRLTPDPSVR